MLARFPLLGLPAFYDSFFYVVFYWIALATKLGAAVRLRRLLQPRAMRPSPAYVHLGHAVAEIRLAFLATIPAAAVGRGLGALIGLLVFRQSRLRGELFALMTLAVTFILATVILNTPIDGGAGVFLSSVPPPQLVESQTASIYLLGLIIAAGAVGIAWWVFHSRFGLGLFAIADDEDVAEVRGAHLPLQDAGLRTFLRDRRRHGRRACDVRGLPHRQRNLRHRRTAVGDPDERAGRLASLAGGPSARPSSRWRCSTSAGQAVLGRAVIALMLIVAVLMLPEGIVPTWSSAAPRAR